MKDRQLIAVAVLTHGRRYWIQRRQGTVHLDGYWEFPGGKIRAGESPREAVIREVREEVGIELPDPELFRVVEHDYPEKSVRIFFFRSEVEDFNGEGRWVLHADLHKYRFPKANREVVDRLVEDSSGRKPQRHFQL